MRRIIGIVLIVLGVLGVAFGGITYTKEETVIDLGPIDARAETRERLPIPPVIGGVSLVVGIVLLVLPRPHVVRFIETGKVSAAPRSRKSGVGARETAAGVPVS